MKASVGVLLSRLAEAWAECPSGHRQDLETTVRTVADEGGEECLVCGERFLFVVVHREDGVELASPILDWKAVAASVAGAIARAVLRREELPDE